MDSIKIIIDKDIVDKIEIIYKKIENNKIINNIFDIKSYNNIEKKILDMFINKFIYLNPNFFIINYKKNLLKNSKIISNSYYLYIDILNVNNISKDIKNILQIGIVPNFIEAYQFYNKNAYNSDFIRINKKNTLYNILIKKFNKNIKYNTINIINNFDNLNNLSIKYDLIVFNIYKNNYDNNILLFKDNNHIVKQIIFSINNICDNGTLILLLPGNYINNNKEIIIILKYYFKSIILYHSILDFTFRYFIICKNYMLEREKNDIINNFMINKNNKNSYVSITNNEIIKKNDDIINIFINKLTSKFIYINTSIKKIINVFKNNKIIKKIYNYNYKYQLYNTYLFLLSNKIITTQNAASLEQSQRKFLNKINKYKILINNVKFNDKIFTITPVFLKNEYKNNILLIKDNKKIFLKKFYSLKYLKLYNLFIYDTNYNYKIFKEYLKIYKLYDLYFKKLKILDDNNIEILSFINILIIQEKENINKNDNIIYSPIKNNIDKILNYYNVKNIIFIDYNNYTDINTIIHTHIFNTSNYNYIIKFCLKNISPLFISIIYILSIKYKNNYIIRSTFSSGYYYFISLSSNNIKINLSENYNKTIFNNMTYLIEIKNDFVNNLNNILFKIIILDIIENLKIKYIYTKILYNNSDLSIVNIDKKLNYSKENKINKYLDNIYPKKLLS